MSPTSYHCSTPRCLFSTERPSRQITSLCQSLNCECKVTTFFRHDQIFSPLFSPLPHFSPQIHQSAPSHLLYLSSILSIIFILNPLSHLSLPSFPSILSFSLLSSPLLLESVVLFRLVRPVGVAVLFMRWPWGLVSPFGPFSIQIVADTPKGVTLR